MEAILLAIPVLNRPERVAPLVESIEEATTVSHRTLFLCSPGDDQEIAACQDIHAQHGAHVAFVVVDWFCGPGDYARKINEAFRVARALDFDWVFTGADDLCFCPGWDVNALQCAYSSGRPVIGTNDLGNARVTTGQHSTHSLVRVDYVERYGTVDEPGKLYHEGYDHNFCDDEMIHTARMRHAFMPCQRSEVPHLHPDWAKAPMDETYVKGKAHFFDDSRLYHIRSPLWLAISHEQRVEPVKF